jgi:hypothetical protein
MEMAQIKMVEAEALSMECESYRAMRQATSGHGEFSAHAIHGRHCARELFAVLVLKSMVKKMAAIESRFGFASALKLPQRVATTSPGAVDVLKTIRLPAG